MTAGHSPDRPGEAHPTSREAVTLERIAVALERIATALEDRPLSTGNHMADDGDLFRVRPVLPKGWRRTAAGTRGVPEREAPDQAEGSGAWGESPSVPPGTNGPDHRKKDSRSATEAGTLTVPEVAQALRLHPATIREYLRAGRLRGVRPGGGNWRVRREDLDAFVAGPPAPGTPKPRPVTGRFTRQVREMTRSRGEQS